MHFAEDVFDVTWIDGGGFDLDEDFAGGRRGFGGVARLEEIRCRFFKTQGEHGLNVQHFVKGLKG